MSLSAWLAGSMYELYSSTLYQCYHWLLSMLQCSLLPCVYKYGRLTNMVTSVCETKIH